MSYNRFVVPINLELRSSFLLTTVFFLIHCLALICVWPLPMALVWQLLLSVAVIVSAVHVLRRYARLISPVSVVRLGWIPGQGWELETRAGRVEEVRLLGSSYVHPGLVILNFFQLQQRAHISVPVVRDMLGVEDFRQLRVHLRWNQRIAGE